MAHEFDFGAVTPLTWIASYGLLILWRISLIITTILDMNKFIFCSTIALFIKAEKQ